MASATAPPITERTLHIVDVLMQQLIAVFALLILWEVLKNYSLTNVGTWHIILCTLGFSLCMVEALLLFSQQNAALRDVDRVSRGALHGVIMLIACASITTGISLKIYQKNSRGSSHFTTTHGALGLTSWLLVFISVLLGIIAGNAKHMAKFAKPSLFRMIHLFLGVATFVLGILTLGYGLNYLEAYTGKTGKIYLLVFLGVFSAYSLAGSVKTCYNFFFNK